jgi:hypothetical protein
MMTTRRADIANACSAIAAVTVVISLWQPWYQFRIPAEVIDRAEQFGQQLGIGPLIQRAAAIASQLGPLHVDAWQIFQQTDVVLLVLAVIAGGLAILAYTGRATGVEGVIAVAGAVALVVTGHRIISPPGPAGLLHPMIGAYLALGGAATMIAAGLWGRRQTSASQTQTFAPTGTVAPLASATGPGEPAKGAWPEEPGASPWD